MRDCGNSKIHVSNNSLLSICLLLMLVTLLLVPSIHCNTLLHLTTLHPTTLHYTYRHFTYSSFPLTAPKFFCQEWPLVLAKSEYSGKVDEDEIGRARSRHVREEKCIQGSGRCIWKAWDWWMWKGFIWLRIGSSGGLLWTRQWTLGFRKYGKFLDNVSDH